MLALCLTACGQTDTGSPPPPAPPPATPRGTSVPFPAALNPENLQTRQATSDNESMYQEAVRAGREDLKASRYSDAAVELSKAVAVHPDNPVVLRMLGNAHAYNNDMNRARRALEASIRLDPGQVGTHYELALVGLSSQDLDLALRESRITAKMDPNNPRAMELFGRVLYQTGQNRLAIAVLEPLIARKQETEDGKYFLALAYKKEGRFQEARDLLQEVLKIHPGRAEAYWDLSQVLQHLGEARAAEEAMQKFTALGGSEQAGVAREN